MVQPPNGKRMIPIYIDEAIYREIKVYAAETDQSFQEIIKFESEAFEQSLLKVVTTIKEMRSKAERERIRIEEEQMIASEHPMPVLGHEVEPITQ